MLHALRDFGFGKKSMDSKVLEEADAIGKVGLQFVVLHQKYLKCLSFCLI